MMTDVEALRSFLQSRREKVTSLLCDMIRIPSTRGGEGDVQRYLADQLSKYADMCELTPIDDSIIDDPDYSFKIDGMTYKDRPNLKIIKKGTGKGKTILFNSHTDVVPPSQGQENAFNPVVKDGIVYGRGACDAKGQLAVMALLLETLSEFSPLAGDVTFHIVVEEENGGNGSLAMVRNGCAADAAIVMEPSAMNIFPSIRGAVWFDVECTGHSGHSGSANDVVSALKKGIQAVGILENYNEKLWNQSKNVPLFTAFTNPMPITIGQLESGDWPASTPNQARFKGVFGFLPNKTKEQVMEEMEQELKENGDEWLKGHFGISFPYRHDGSVLDPSHPLVKDMEMACGICGIQPEISAMTASCDAWFYNNMLNIPTIVFGPGELKYAHSREEQIAIDDILKSVEILYTFLQLWQTAGKGAAHVSAG